MNAIILTEQQESRLLEMCNKLFPSKSKEFEWEYSLYMPGFLTIEYYDKKIIETMELHWFEFCMTKLVDKLYNSINYTDSAEFNINLHVDLMLDMVNFKINPIDFLYKEFLKTKTSNK